MLQRLCCACRDKIKPGNRHGGAAVKEGRNCERGLPRMLTKFGDASLEGTKERGSKWRRELARGLAFFQRP